MKSILLLIAFCLSFSFAVNAQTKKPVKKTAKVLTNTPVEPSANGKFKFSAGGLINDTDSKDFVVITAQRKKANEIKSSIVSTLSSMYTNPSKVISTLGDNIINVNAYASNAIDVLNDISLITTRYSFTYNIKIEVKDGKIKIDSPSFSNITKQELTFTGSTMNKKNLDTLLFFAELYEGKGPYQVPVEDLINSHITKIVSGLSSSSDW